MVGLVETVAQVGEKMVVAYTDLPKCRAGVFEHCLGDVLTFNVPLIAVR